MSWAQRLKRVFNIDIETCTQCGGPAKVIASIEDPVMIKKFLDQLQEKGETQDAVRLPDTRGPPQATLFDCGKANNSTQGRCLKRRARAVLGLCVKWGGNMANDRPIFAELPQGMRQRVRVEDEAGRLVCALGVWLFRE